MARSSLAPCGTPGAARRHIRRGEPLDEACEAANKERRRRLYEAEVAAGKRPVKAAKMAARRAAINYLIDSHLIEFEMLHADLLADELEKRGLSV